MCLTVSAAAGGRVTESLVGFDCHATTCTTTVPRSITLNLQASADAGYGFIGWMGH